MMIDPGGVRVAITKLVVSGDAAATERGAGWNEALVRVLAILSEHEAIADQETRAGRSARRSAGLHDGGSIPYGYQLAPDGATLIAHPEEAATVAAARELNGKGSFAKIAAELTRRGMRARNGKAFTRAQIRRMIVRGDPGAPGPSTRSTRSTRSK